MMKLKCCKNCNCRVSIWHSNQKTTIVCRHCGNLTEQDIYEQYEKNKCAYCNRRPSRHYNRKPLCELHYLLENPERNIHMADLKKISRMRQGDKHELNLIKNLKRHLGNNYGKYRDEPIHTVAELMAYLKLHQEAEKKEKYSH